MARSSSSAPSLMGWTAVDGHLGAEDVAFEDRAGVVEAEPGDDRHQVPECSGGLGAGHGEGEAAVDETLAGVDAGVGVEMRVGQVEDQPGELGGAGDGVTCFHGVGRAGDEVGHAQAARPQPLGEELEIPAP